MAEQEVKMIPVVSSNIKAIGYYVNQEKKMPMIRIEFQRGASYDYFPCTEAEFKSAFDKSQSISDWFKTFKVGKNYVKLD